MQTSCEYHYCTFTDTLPCWSPLLLQLYRTVSLLASLHSLHSSLGNHESIGCRKEVFRLEPAWTTWGLCPKCAVSSAIGTHLHLIPDIQSRAKLIIYIVVGIAWTILRLYQTTLMLLVSPPACSYLLLLYWPPLLPSWNPLCISH